MPITTLEPLANVATATLENAHVRIVIEKKTGLVRSLVFKKKNVDLFAQLRQNIRGYAAGLRIFDERDSRWYDDLSTPFKLTGLRHSGRELRFTKQYQGAPFTVTVTLRLEKDALHWEVQAKKTSAKAPDRSLRVYFAMPLIAGWRVWGPCNAGEFTFDGMTPFAFNYLQQSYVSDYDIILPMVSHYSRELDVGFSMLEPIDAQVPAARFQFLNDRAFNWGTMEKPLPTLPMLETMNYYIGLVGRRPMATKVMMLFHEGDWRPAVGQVFRKWKTYFVPPNPTMYEHEGIFGGNLIGWHGEETGGADFQNRDVPLWVRGKVKTFEVHGHFEYYADYINEHKDRWYNIIAYEKLWKKWDGKKSANELYDWVRSHTAQELLAEIEGKRPAEVTREEAERRLFTVRADVQCDVEALADAGIAPFWYFNYTDGFRPVVEQNWPDSLCRNEDGSITPSGWMMCHCLNSDPRWSFGRFQIAAARQIIAEHPRLAGFFLDCFRHFEVEFGHDDGITVVNNKPAYSVNFSYDAAEGIIKKMLHKRNMCTFCNKPQTIRTMRWVDGMMLEGGGDTHEEKYFWACLAKPMVFLWTSNEHSDEENCRRAVLYGCFPKFVGSEDGIARRERYMPLYEALRRRVFCFEADPLRVPKGCRGKLYTVGEDYVAGIVNVTVDEGASLAYDKPPYAMFRVARGHDVGRVGILLPGAGEWRYVDFKFNGAFLAVPLEGFSTCAAVKLFVTKQTGRKIGPEKFKGSVDSCGDPDSSFQDISDR